MKPSAVEALALWDEGKAVPAIQVESERSSQEDIYAIAFDLLRRHKQMEERVGKEISLAWMTDSDASEQPDPSEINYLSLSEREFDAAVSIAVVAALKGWTVMLQEHQHPNIKPITVQKPNQAVSA